MNARLNVSLAIVCLLAGGEAFAAPSCTLLSMPTLNFGAYSAVGGVKDAEGALIFSCIPDLLIGPTVSYSVSLDTGGAPSYFPRRLSSGGFSLQYNLYSDIARTVIWGDGTPGTSLVTGACTGTCSIQVYGRISAGQSVPAAEYSDDVLVTLDF